jgi:hypothetical protein
LLRAKDSSDFQVCELCSFLKPFGFQEYLDRFLLISTGAGTVYYSNQKGNLPATGHGFVRQTAWPVYINARSAGLNHADSGCFYTRCDHWVSHDPGTVRDGPHPHLNLGTGLILDHESSGKWGNQCRFPSPRFRRY